MREEEDWCDDADDDCKGRDEHTSLWSGSESASPRGFLPNFLDLHPVSANVDATERCELEDDVMSEEGRSCDHGLHEVSDQTKQFKGVVKIPDGP